MPLPNGEEKQLSLPSAFFADTQCPFWLERRLSTKPSACLTPLSRLIFPVKLASSDKLLPAKRNHFEFQLSILMTLRNNTVQPSFPVWVLFADSVADLTKAHPFAYSAYGGCVFPKKRLAEHEFQYLQNWGFPKLLTISMGLGHAKNRSHPSHPLHSMGSQCNSPGGIADNHC